MVSWTDPWEGSTSAGIPKFTTLGDLGLDAHAIYQALGPITQNTRCPFNTGWKEHGHSPVVGIDIGSVISTPDESMPRMNYAAL
jgi:hypothetical protein